jgi:hypothetical protein
MPNTHRILLGWAFLTLGSTIGLSQWQPINTGFPDAVVDSTRMLYSTCSVFAFGTDLFVGTRHPTTVQPLTIRSTDGGTFWTAASNGLSSLYYSRSFTSNGPILFAGTNGNGVYRTTDNGALWTRASSGLPNPTYVFSMTSFQGKIFAGTLDGMYMSTNNGSSWVAFNPGATIQSATEFAAIDTNLFVSGTTSGIFRLNSSTGWSAASNGLRGATIYSLLAVGNTLFAGTSNGIYRSSDLGGLWTASSTGMAGGPDLSIWSMAACGSDIFAATYFGGVYRSVNNGSTWVKMNDGLLSSTPLALAVIDTVLFLGTRDDGMYKYILNTRGNLQLSFKDAEDWGWLGQGGRVELYNSNAEMIYQTNTDMSSQVTIPHIPGGTGYYYKVFANRNTPWGEQFWGEKTGITIVANQTTYDTHTHNTPYMPGLRIYRDSTNELLPDGAQRLVTPGTRLRIELDIKNPMYDGARPVSAYGSLHLDRDKAAPYDVTLTTDPQNLSTGTTSTFVFSCDAPAMPGPYYLSVAAFAASNRYATALTDASGWHDPAFRVQSAPQLVSPVNLASGLPTSVTMRWHPSEGAMGYHLRLTPTASRDSGLTVNDSTLTDTTYTVSMLQPNTQYYWWVEAITTAGKGGSSATWGFRTAQGQASRPELVYPGPNAALNTTVVAFVWRKATLDVTRYWHDLATDSLFAFRISDSTITDTTFLKTGLPNGTYWWRVRAFNAAGWGAYSDARKFSVAVTGIEEGGQMPTEFCLEQNYPNPFNPSTDLQFGLPSASHVTLVLYNALGQEIKVLVDAPINAGRHVVRLDGSGLPSGTYFCRMRAGDFHATILLHLIK